MPTASPLRPYVGPAGQRSGVHRGARTRPSAGGRMESRRFARRRAIALLAPLGVYACSGGEPPTAPQAPTLVTTPLPLVNSLADPGDGTCNAAECTLREALADQSRSEIGFPKGFGGTITLDPA